MTTAEREIVKVLTDFIHMQSAIEQGVAGKPHTSQSVAFLFKNARAALLAADASPASGVTEEQADRMEEALHKIESWSRAYPLEVFPKPDIDKAAELLKAGGITIDSISAHCMRHVVEGVGKIAREALIRGDRE